MVSVSGCLTGWFLIIMKLRLIVTISLYALLNPVLLYASSCRISDNDTAIKNAKAIFIGKVTEIDVLNRDKYPDGEYYGKCGDKIISFSFSKIYKGEIDDNIKIFSSDGCVGLGGYFDNGREYLVYAYEAKEKGWYGKSSSEINAGQLYSTVCGRTSALGYDQSRKDIEYLNNKLKDYDGN